MSLEYTRFSVQTLLPSPVLLVFHLEMSEASSDKVKEIFGDLVYFQTPILSHICDSDFETFNDPGETRRYC